MVPGGGTTTYVLVVQPPLLAVIPGGPEIPLLRDVVPHLIYPQIGGRKSVFSAAMVEFDTALNGKNVYEYLSLIHI